MDGERMDPLAEDAGRGVVKYVRFSEELGETICSRVAGGKTVDGSWRAGVEPNRP